MADLIFSPRFVGALEQVFEFAAELEPDRAPDHVQLILDGLEVLRTHPMIGRPVDREMRELVLGSGRRCYLALYRYFPSTDRVLALTVRHARQAGYR